MRLFATGGFWFIAALAVAPGFAQAVECAAVPDTMRAARIHAAAGPEGLAIETVAVPAVARGEVLVRVHYAAVNPVDWKLQMAGRLPFPATPGGDFSGEIVGVGPGVGGFACGDLVSGIVDQGSRQGSYAEYLAVPASEIIAKPQGLTMQEAAAFTTVAVATHRFLIRAADLQTGERVLVHGGAGGVGSIVVQVAKARGAYVIATASARNREFLEGIGADEVIDYRSVKFEDVVDGIDVVIDTVGGETSVRSGQVLKPGGRLVTLGGARATQVCEAGKIVCPATPPWDVQAGLAMVLPLLESGAVKVNIDRVYPLAEARAAQEHNKAGHTRGKVVIAMLDNTPGATP